MQDMIPLGYKVHRFVECCSPDCVFALSVSRLFIQTDVGIS